MYTKVDVLVFMVMDVKNDVYEELLDISDLLETTLDTSVKIENVWQVNMTRGERLRREKSVWE